MPRITIKGGIWKNTEDEILKAAIMKYGKNQWARIASLLHKKSAKQCKARWSEWLDPSIKKTEWSQEEEEKLLHLAKMFPTQWRTIAPFVGRTATQCLERYEYILDKAQQKDQEFGEDDPRKLKPGEIDPNPETKPARPDPKDMDEDELEMLSEARARLANTQGKKAKRKAREKQLEEARRLAALQKRRELRAAGIHLREGGKKRKRGIDYMNEIPFEKKPLPGFYDTSNEIQAPEGNFKGQRIDNETRRSIELKERKKDKEKLKKRKEQDLPNAILDDKFLEPARKRSKLVLPEPQISDRELEEIIKFGKESEAIRQQAEENGGASQVLLNDYSLNAAEKLANLRTPRVPDSQNSILNEARDIMALTNVNTPLLGGENTPLISHSFDAVGKQVLSTPNTVLGTPFRTPALKMGGGITPAVGGETPGSTPSIHGRKVLQTPLRTPMRDGYNLNANEEFEDEVDDKERKVSLKKGFDSLPAPIDVDIVFSMEEEEDMIDAVEDVEPEIVEDQAELDRLKEERLRKERELEMMSRSKVVQRQLPRPTIINDDILRTDEDNMTDLQKAEELIKNEMLIMQHYDNMRDLPRRKGMTTKQLQQQESLNVDYLKNHPYEPISADDLEEARELICQEMEYVKEKMAHGDVTFDIYDQVRDQCIAQLLFIPSENKFTRNNMASKKNKIESFEKRLENNKKVRADKAKVAVKLEKKHKILVAGYQTKFQEMIKQLRDLEDQMEQASIERYTFNRLRNQERLAIERRLNSAKEDVDRQTVRHNDLQKKYVELMRRREDLMVEVNERQS